MITAGIDIGSTTTKVVILDSGRIRAALVVPTSALPARAAEAAFQQALLNSGLQDSDVAIIATTGYGRRLVDFGDKVMTEIRACAAGACFHTPAESDIHTIIDVGGQDTKVLALNDQYDIDDFSMNDKCAAGTGRFLEVLAQKLELDYQQFVDAALSSQTMLQMNATCAVFAESEVIGLLARGETKADIAAAAHNAIASRIASMVRRVGQRGAYCFVGGGARNAALVRAIEEQLNQPVLVPADAQLIVALGAAYVVANSSSGGRNATL